jgi:hypothetical protein
LLPFGVKKNSAGIPVPDPETYPGLLLAFGAAAKGTSDREVAVLLSERGFRTSGNRGHNLFIKDTVRPMLQNRFYLGELPDGAGGWRTGVHEPLLDDALFEAAQQARERRATNPLPVKRKAHVYSLSGLLRCQYCGGTLHIHQDKGRTRAYCYRGRQGPKCEQRSTFLDVYETQILDYLESFSLPDDLQQALVHVQERSREGIADVATQRQRIETQLANIRTLFELGDLGKAEYVARRERLVHERDSLRETDEWEGILAQAAAFLSDLPAAWRAADDAQRNALARMLFVQIRIKDDWVVAVEPQPSFAPFFHWDCQVRRLSGGSDGDRFSVLELAIPRRIAVPEVRPQHLRQRCGSSKRYGRRARKLTSAEESTIRALAATRSLRSLAADFGVSHETIRGILQDPAIVVAGQAPGRSVGAPPVLG